MAETGSYLFSSAYLMSSFDGCVTADAAHYPADRIVIKLGSPLSVSFFYTAWLNGRVFRMFKFRTMKVGSREERHRWTCDRDPRRTP